MKTIVVFVLRNIRLGATIDGLVRKERHELPPGSRYGRAKAEMRLSIYIFYLQTIHIFRSQMKKIDLTRKTAYNLSKKDKNQETSYEVF